MSPRERVARMNKMMAHERRHGKLQPIFLYFSDPERPAGQRFLGACIVMARGFITAIDAAHRLGINPGGAVYHFDTPPHDPSMRDRLITGDEELAALGFTRRQS